MAGTPTVYVICDQNCKFEGMTKEQILTAIKQAVESGEIKDVDAGFVSTIKTINGLPLKFFVGEQAAYDALTEEEKKNLFAIITNDTTKEGLLSSIEELEKSLGELEKWKAAIMDGSQSVKKADHATNADHATAADRAAAADRATNADHAAAADTANVAIVTESVRGTVTLYAETGLDNCWTASIRFEPYSVYALFIENKTYILFTSEGSSLQAYSTSFSEVENMRSYFMYNASTFTLKYYAASETDPSKKAYYTWIAKTKTETA